MRILLHVVFLAVTLPCPGEGAAPWTSRNRLRLLANVALPSRQCSHTPATIEYDFQAALARQGIAGKFDEYTLEIVPVHQRQRVAHRVERYYGASIVRLHFVVPDANCTNIAIYFDSLESGRGRPTRYSGLIGNGDHFREDFSRREIAPSHFDGLADLDADGDLDLFKGGVEPFVFCYENIGRSEFVPRGQLASGSVPFKLPCSTDNRSWLTVAFCDVDADGDQDFFPSFGDGPDAGKIIFYRNTTPNPGQFTFERVDALRTAASIPLASGPQAGGWFPSITFVRGWDGMDSNRLDALVGSNHRCWLYRGSGTALSFNDPVALQANGSDIHLINPRFETADIDDDGDLDLFAGTQPGTVYWFQNVGSRHVPILAQGKAVAWTGKYLIGDAHSGVAVADFNGDGAKDILSGRFWERADLSHPTAPRDYGGLFRKSASQFIRAPRAAPFTRQFQACDAVRQNSVRALDWDADGKLDLLAGDTDGFIWFFRNQHGLFAKGEQLALSLAASGGHVRFDVSDWNGDGRPDLLTADGSGTLTVFPNVGSRRKPRFAAAQKVPWQVGSRASLLVCDWNSDHRRDLLLADDKGYYFAKNIGTDAAPVLAKPVPVLFGGRNVRYVRPNLGAFVDWDRDGRKDLIGCHFENTIRFYRNIGSAEEPQFADPEGVTILKGESPQMISGADVVDWNGDGDLDLLTGQGHGGSALRFYERDWLENELAHAHPHVTISKLEAKPDL